MVQGYFETLNEPHSWHKPSLPSGDMAPCLFPPLLADSEGPLTCAPDHDLLMTLLKTSRACGVPQLSGGSEKFPGGRSSNLAPKSFSGGD